MSQATKLVFTPDRNQTRHDYTGAFEPEARRFVEVQGLTSGLAEIVKVDITLPKLKQRQVVLDALSNRGVKLSCVAFFCHGWYTGIQLGFSNATVGKLAKAIAQASSQNVVVPLYACSTGGGTKGEAPAIPLGGDGGFADLLRDSLCEYRAVNCRVVAHTTSGHTTKNPFVRYFEGDGNPYGGAGGIWVVRPYGPLWKKWVASLKDGDNRFLFPFLSTQQVRTRLVESSY